MTRSDSRPLIVHVVYRFAVGGLENGVVNLIDRLPERDWRHAVLALDRVDPAFRARVRRSDVRFLELGKRPGHLLREFPRLRRMFRELAPAIVHTRNLAALEAQVPAWLAGVPFRIHGEHGRDVGDPDGTNVRRQRIRRLYRPLVHRYVAVAPDLAEYLRQRVGVPEQRVTSILNGVDTEKFRPPPDRREVIDGSPFSQPGLLVFGSVGRLDPVKDHVGLVRAFDLLIRREPSLRGRARLAIVGEGPERLAIETCVRQCQLSDVVWLAGERNDIDAVLRGLDVFVLPSRAEGLSNTILEAMASGLPVIATQVGANGSLISSGVNGLLVPWGSPEALAEAMRQLAANAELRSSYGEQSRLLCESRFALGHMISAYDALYRGQRSGRELADAQMRAGW